jgi:hypothetical protein
MTDMTSNANNFANKSSASTPAADHAVQDLKSAVLTGAHDLGDGVRHVAHDVIGETKKGAETRLSAGKSRAAEGLGSVANALRKTGEQLRSEQDDSLTGYLDTAAQKVDGVSHYLKDRSLSDVAGDLKSFARREPALFLGGALALGLIGGRFLKSSSRADSSEPALASKTAGPRQEGGSYPRNPSRGGGSAKSSATSQSSLTASKGDSQPHAKSSSDSPKAGTTAENKKPDPSSTSTKPGSSAASKGSGGT